MFVHTATSAFEIYCLKEIKNKKKIKKREREERRGKKGEKEREGARKRRRWKEGGMEGRAFPQQVAQLITCSIYYICFIY